jgi:membrane protein implicated in regulation of membrane protease activity
MELTFQLILWIIVGIVLLVAEIFSGTLYLLFAGIAAFMTGLLEWIYPQPLAVEFVVFAVFSVGGVLVLKKKFRQPKVSFKNDEDRTLVLSENLSPNEEKSILYQGAPWTAVNSTNRELRTGDRVRIVKIEGITLILGE